MNQTQQLIYTVIDAIAAHNLLLYVREDRKDERARMVAGATLGALGFTFGPELEQRIRQAHDAELSEATKRRLVTAAGGALMGAVIMYCVGPDLYRNHAGGLAEEVEEELRRADPRQPDFDRAKPGGLITVGSAAWLGYSLLRDKKEEDRERQLWGLGGGLLGYVYGPTLLRKIRNVYLPESSASDAAQMFARGAALFGAITGGAVGYHVGKPR